ncbi:23S rRNA (pseudouridine(1915)-N(3))-methyltransferase RlmH [Candidatus Saccharibacteria bacterium]|nr:23S rRNA (pseudouridine(1915)-N(3))-methyltransferase RlmH [Candidatus Saccharibacteria bacterium]
MRGITIIAIGSKHDSDLRSAIERYETRLRLLGGVRWLLLPSIASDTEAVRQAESTSIRRKLLDNDVIVLLDERGTQLDSKAFADKLSQWRELPGRLVFVIGGAYGVDDELRDRVHFVWSLSPLVFPHQLVRLLLVEQIYRGEMIRSGHPYHHI